MTEDDKPLFEKPEWKPYEVKEQCLASFSLVCQRNVIVNSIMDGEYEKDDTKKYYIDNIPLSKLKQHIQKLRMVITELDYNTRLMQEQLTYWRNEAQKPNNT